MIMCRIMVSRILALLVWALVAASAAHWGLRWLVKPTALPPGTGAVSMASVPRGDIVKLLSGPAPVESSMPDPNQQSALAARVQLLGVVAPRGGGNGPGVALLVVDGKPARAFKTGHAVDGDLIVQTVTQQNVAIGPRGGPAALTLDLPLMQPAATGSLPPAGMGGGMPPGVPGGSDNAYVPPEAFTPPEQMPPPGAGGMAETPIEGTDPNAAAPQGDASAAPAPRPRRGLSSRLRRPTEAPAPVGTM